MDSGLFANPDGPKPVAAGLINGLPFVIGLALGINAAALPPVPMQPIAVPSPLAVAAMDEIDHAEMTELVVDAWRMVVPKKIFAAYEARELR